MMIVPGYVVRARIADQDVSFKVWGENLWPFLQVLTQNGYCHFSVDRDEWDRTSKTGAMIRQEDRASAAQGTDKRRGELTL